MHEPKDFICAVPFTSFEVQEHSNFLCCASWLTKYVPKNKSVIDSWNSKEAYEIRESILDGSYRYCNKTQCPFLSQIKTDSNKGVDNPLAFRNNLPTSLKSKITQHKNRTLLPDTVQFSFDRSCNLRCPSCRIGFITSTGKKLKEVEATIEEIETHFSSNIRVLYITGSGDPFTSPSFKKFLRNFDKAKYPKLRKIHLHTNATKWDKRMWESMKGIHPYVKSCEISIDAGTKDTYENKTRLGGNWDELMENLEFIKTIKTLQKIKTSFVVQKSNYREMKVFYHNMYNLFGNRVQVFFGKINNWGTFSEEEFNKEKIWDPSHPEHFNFLEELNNVLPAKNILTNMQEFLKQKSKLF